MKSGKHPPSKQRGHWGRTSEDRRVSASPVQTFDRDTGQIYTEAEVVVDRKKHNLDWIGALRTPLIAKKFTPSRTGPRSLAHIARIKCAREIRNLTPCHFEAVPWSLGSAIWDDITSHYQESFYAWRTLASVFNHEDEFGSLDYRYHLNIKHPSLPVQEYFRGLSSPELKWVSALRISPKQISAPELVSISTIKNLAVLDLSDGQVLFDTTPSLFDERIMRTWAELASTGKAFASLRVLMLGWQDNLSDWLFKYLNCFPSLCFVVATDCKHMHQKNRAEWEATVTSHEWKAHHAKRSVKMLRPLLEDEKFHTAAVSRLYYHSRDLWQNLMEPRKSDETPMLPLVECWLGTPRLWTHILDEFPGTRTIFFENTTVRSTMDPGSDTNVPGNTDSTKRTRDPVNANQSPASPPRKRSHGIDSSRVRGPMMTAAGLLEDMGVTFRGKS